MTASSGCSLARRRLGAESAFVALGSARYQIRDLELAATVRRRIVTADLPSADRSRHRGLLRPRAIEPVVAPRADVEVSESAVRISTDSDESLLAQIRRESLLGNTGEHDVHRTSLVVSAGRTSRAVSAHEVDVWGMKPPNRAIGELEKSRMNVRGLSIVAITERLACGGERVGAERSVSVRHERESLSSTDRTQDERWCRLRRPRATLGYRRR